MTINLLSDTVTRPTPGMLEAMMKAEVGDDVFGQDPTINRLQAYTADLFGMEAALFCPSGTMTNQIALKVHLGDLEEVICHEYSHIFQYETGGYAFNSRAGIQLLPGLRGKITADQVAGAIRPDYDWLPKSRLVVLENTCNKGGGGIYTQEEMRAISELCRYKGLALHLDGARLFNALVETGDAPREIGALFDSISICLSKGLGAPVGSLLLGEREFIRRARRFRKVMGGGMRQAGYLAAAGLYALQHQVDRLREDHAHARQLAGFLEKCAFVKKIHPVETNILLFDVQGSRQAEKWVKQLHKAGILCSAFGPDTIRWVTHLDISPAMVAAVGERLQHV